MQSVLIPPIDIDWYSNPQQTQYLLAVLCKELSLSATKISFIEKYYEHWTQAVEDKFACIKIEENKNPRLSEWIKKATNICEFLPGKINKLKNTLDLQNINIVDFENKHYPSQLRHLSDFPLVLYYQGDLSLLNQTKHFLTVVGSRNLHSYASSCMHLLLPQVCRMGIGTVSGLAFGADALAHKLALENQAKTIAVIGSGLDNDSFYPIHNLELKENILKSGGLVLSEYGPGVKATQYSFPRRNRILAALTELTLVIQAGTKSGSLITARCALDIGRSVATIPAQINMDVYGGNISLLKDGAIVISSYEDVIALMNIPITKKVGKLPNPIPNFSSPIEEKIYHKLQNAEIGFDELCLCLNMDGSELSTVLTMLELKGLVARVEDNNWICL